MKLATYVMTYDQGKWLMRNIENAYPHVDQIYVMHSELPWGYKPEARSKYKNSVDLNMIKESKYMDKITIIEGDWLGDTEQRNFCLQRAKADEYDYLMIHDADEFFFHEDFEKIKKCIIDNPWVDVFSINLYAYWKSFKYILINHDYTKIGGCNQTIVNLHTIEKYDWIRDVQVMCKHLTIPDVVCYHGSYVLTDEEILKKVNMTSHSNEYDGNTWYKEVWLKWTPKSTNLHPVHPEVWIHAEKFIGELPEVIKDFDVANNLDKI